jgi:hypothetical protein
LAAFLETTELSAGQRNQVSGAAKKVNMYSKIMNLRQINTAGASIFDTRLLLRQNGIFVQTHLMEEFKTALDMLGKAQIERHMHFQHELREIGYEDSSRLIRDGEQMFDHLQSLVRARLIRD